MLTTYGNKPARWRQGHQRHRLRVGLKIATLGILVAAQAICLLAVSDVVYLPRPAALLLGVSIIGAWIVAALPKPRDPNGAWQPRSKLSIVLVIAGIAGSLVLGYCGALIVYRSHDACVSNKPGPEAFRITRSPNILTGMVRCKYEHERAEPTLIRHIPFGELF